VIRTWQIETAVVALALALTVAFTGGHWVEWCGALAVLATFGHASVTERLVERESNRARPEVDCHRWSRRYWVTKECAWLVYFIAQDCWSALVGVGVFLAYPLWRSWYRRRFPVGRGLGAICSAAGDISVAKAHEFTINGTTSPDGRVEYLGIATSQLNGRYHCLAIIDRACLCSVEVSIRPPCRPCTDAGGVA
jgi:hypothetical protein